MTGSIIIGAGVDQWRQCRTAFEDHLESLYAQATEATNGVMLNKRGKAAGVSSYSLMFGPAVRVTAYASEELIEFFAHHNRITYAQFERAWFQVSEEN
jgi:predicted lipoprotein